MSYEQDIKHLGIIEKRLALFEELAEGIERALKEKEKEIIDLCKHAELDEEETNRILSHNKELKYYTALLDKVKEIEQL